ncbi:hypothetical protein PUNSTDRAFT_65904 [Punctularia strigosozonata HHB-11173 SS5]|uniref:uncharacterized protein n=1 Tax=Punctularia strigosozonata (strain HHB-11173) TaxID=741275 RepID=UPI000441795C|nr:uncharacterized protein PUNSTDRAFT_65904 [Punctularia strigosozonata HHB-11173 SS5]EIN09944.1 hypothetical protein PUNSTDRAFT_65904 [Punctularia strigosozonata HHB-11173 SS5]
MDPSLHLGPSSAFDIERPASSRSETASVGSSNRSSVSPGRAPSSCSTHSASVSEAGSDHAAALSSVAEENLVVPGIDGRPFRVAKLKVTSNATRAASERRRTKDAIFACPIESCGKRFTTKNNLIGHVTAHQGLKPRKCPFPGCDQAFARQSDCKRHERKHYEKAM